MTSEPSNDESLAKERWGEHNAFAQERWVAHRQAHTAESELESERWKSHADQHEYIAGNLAEYKAQSNEWRASLSDLRATYVARTEHDLLNDRLLEFREELQKAIATEREERREQQNLRQGQEQGISRTAASIVTSVGVIGMLLGAIAVVMSLVR